MKQTQTDIKAAVKDLKNMNFCKSKEKPFTVRFPSGVSLAYKTLCAAIKNARNAQLKMNIPDIVTANTYFWTAGGTAGSRRSNEKRRQAEIDAFCNSLNQLPGFDITGSYSESCKNVYKSMEYRVDGHKTNLTGVIGAAKKWGITLVK